MTAFAPDLLAERLSVLDNAPRAESLFRSPISPSPQVVANPSHPFEFIRTQRSEVERPKGLPHLVQSPRSGHAYIHGPSYHSRTVPPCRYPATQHFSTELNHLEEIGTEFAQPNR